MNPPSGGSLALRSLAAGLWVADRPLPIAVGDVGTRMTVIRLADGGLWLHSPVRLDIATRATLDALGPVRAVVAPNKVHHLFAGDYRSAYPAAKLYGAPGLAEKRPDLSFDAVLGDAPEALWRGQIDQVLVSGAPRINEVAFHHIATRTLVLTDLAFNVAPDGTGGARLFHFVVGSAGRFGPHRFVRWCIRDRAAARRGIDRILSWDFERVIVAHGDVLEQGGPARVRAAFAYLG